MEDGFERGWRRFIPFGACVLLVAGLSLVDSLDRRFTGGRETPAFPPDVRAAMGGEKGVAPPVAVAGVDTTAVDSFKGRLAAFPVLVRLENVTVHDGDTLKADLVFPCGIRKVNQSIRGRGWDAPEVTRTRDTGVFKTMTGPQWREEIARGVVVRDDLRKLLACDSEGVATNPVWVSISDADAAYSRLECDIWTERVKGFGPGAFERVNIREWIVNNGYDRSMWNIRPNRLE